MSGWPVSLVLETNQGGVSVTICGCGALLLISLADSHANYCDIARQALTDLAPIQTIKL